MNWKPLFEELCFRLLGQGAAWPRLLAGVMLTFVPILNLFTFGYLYRYTNQVRSTGDLELPAWAGWTGLFLDGIRFFIVWLLYWLCPVAIVLILSLILGQVGLGLVGSLLTAVIALGSTLIFSCALYRLQSRGNFNSLVEVKLIAEMAVALFKPLSLPLLAFYGFHVLVFPLYGFSLFLGYLVILSYTVLCLKTMELHKRRSL